MNTRQILERFEQTAAYYAEQLDRYDMEQLLRKPSAEEWSLGQMYVHLIQSALHMQLRNVALCGEQAGIGSAISPEANDGHGRTRPTDQTIGQPTSGESMAARQPAGTAADSADGKTEQGRAVFALGSFPPIRISVPPSETYTPKQPESKQQLLDGLQQVVRRMRELEPTLEATPKRSKVPHPSLGALNAVEWFQLVEMHFRHHLRQKERLDAFLAADSPAQQSSSL
jgi:hypothetical protein